jgi:Trypsin
MYPRSFSPDRVIAAPTDQGHGVRMASLRFYVLVLAAVLTLALVPNAGAIVGGTPSSGVDVPVVFVGQIGQPRNACTGVPLSPTLVVTAAHCGLLLDGTAPAGQPFAVFKGPSIAGATVRSGGMFIPHPDFRWGGSGLPHFADADLAVIRIMGPSIPGPYATLAPLGSAEDMKGGDRALDIYGYGVSALLHGQPDPASFGTLRHGPARSLGVKNADPEFLHFKGPACVGDSGGPVLRDGELLAVISFAPSACHSTNYATRVDTDSARGFLAQFG